jgi:cytochrome P450
VEHATSPERLRREPHAEFDHYGQRSIGQSDAAWKELRERCPVAWTEANGGHWVVSGYPEVAAAFKDWETFSSARRDPRYTSLSVGNMEIPPLYPEELDPPEWHPLRRILSELFSPKAVERLGPRIEYWVAHAIDEVIETGRCEMSEDIACAVPAAVTLELLGFPEEDWDRIAWAFHGAASFDRSTPEFAEAARDLRWVSARAGEELAARRGKRGEDALSLIAFHDVDGRPITPEEAEALVLLVIGGGVDTTTSVTCAAFVHLARHLDHRARLTREPELLASATEEFLRVYPPARTHARIVAADAEFAGCRLEAGDRILLSEVAANHDPSAFPDAERFVIDRFPNRHVSFGLGIHRCPGSHLARAQFKEIVRQVLARMGDYEVDLNRVVEYPNWSSIGGWARIPATFTPGPRRLDATATAAGTRKEQR